VETDFGVQHQFVFLKILYWLDGLLNAVVAHELDAAIQTIVMTIRKRLVNKFLLEVMPKLNEMEAKKLRKKELSDSADWEPNWRFLLEPNEKRPKQLIDYPAMTIAQQVTLACAHLYANIRFEELKYLNWTKSDKKITSPNIFRLTSDFELYFV
jgi:hypothetical protein